MALTPPTPGLRALFLDSKQVAKVQVHVKPGDTLHVSDDVADQLVAADPHFKPAVDVTRAEPVNAVGETLAPAPASKRGRARKSADAGEG